MGRMESDDGAEKLVRCRPESRQRLLEGEHGVVTEVFAIYFSGYKINPKLGFKSCVSRDGSFPGFVVGVYL